MIFLVSCTQEEVSNMKIISPAFQNNAIIPEKYTCQGQDISPPLKFFNVSKDTKTLALIMDDPDAPSGTFTHWLIWNIPSTITEINEGERIPYPQGTNDFGRQYYKGPCPPSGTHRYFFTLYALNKELNLNVGARKDEMLKAMRNNIIEKTELIGRYKRK